MRPDGRAVLKDVVVIVLSFVAAAVVVGVLWPQLVDPVLLERNEVGVVTGEVALSERFDNVGWYSLLAGGFGLVLGALLAARRRTHEVVSLLAIVAAACLAAWLSAAIGTWAGPDDATAALAEGKVGDTAPDQVRLTADVAYLVWPISALAGCVIVLWSRPGTREPRHDRRT
jgi:hypothetical protein